MDQSTMAHRAYGTDTTVDHDQISGVGLPRREESNSGENDTIRSSKKENEQ